MQLHKSFGFTKWRGSARLESLLVVTLFDTVVYPVTNIVPFRVCLKRQCTNSRRFRRGAVRSEWLVLYKDRNAAMALQARSQWADRKTVSAALRLLKRARHSLRVMPCGYPFSGPLNDTILVTGYTGSA